MIDGLSLVLAQASPIDAIDWVDVLAQGGSVPLIIWMAYEIVHLRRENDKLNEAAREVARTSIEALVRMSSERRQ